LGLRWEAGHGFPSRSNKWLLIISLVIGLSFGVQHNCNPIYWFCVLFYKTMALRTSIIANVVVISTVLLFVYFQITAITINNGVLWQEIFMVNSWNAF
jgi:hypothetical protein